MILGVEDSTVLGLAPIIAIVIVAGMSFLWNYKTRALPHREFLYQEQIAAYTELAAVISRSLFPCFEFLWGKKELTPEHRTEFVQIVTKAYNELWEQSRKSMVILPLDVSTAVFVLQLALVRDAPKLESPRQTMDFLQNAEWNVYAAVRKRAGIEPLTEDMRRVFGQG